MSIKIDGKKISEEIGQKLSLELQAKNLVGKLSLGILCVGNDPASLTFINVKKRFGEKYGFRVEPRFIDWKDSQDFKNEIITQLKKLQDENDAVIVQLPLPESAREFTDEILSHIQKDKDVDNLNGGNFLAPIVLALQRVLKEVTEDLNDKVFGIVGLGQVVGLPIYNYLLDQRYVVKKIVRENFDEIKKCDVVIAGVGQANLIKKDDLKEGVVLVDYGCSYVQEENENGETVEKMCGDFDAECYAKSSFYTPVPGCMGPLVVANLFENVLQSYSS